MKPIRIGTRGSALALWQSNWVKTQLQRHYPDLPVELQVIHTKGDIILDVPLAKIGDKGLFTKELESKLLAGAIDLAVHSLKDLPTALPAGLAYAAITAREDPADALVSKGHLTLEQLPPAARVLSGSLRRRAQLLARRRDLRIEEIRGNVPTRLRKLEESDAAGIVMSLAGLKRLGLAEKVSQRFAPEDFLPACGQGALALEIRADDTQIAQLTQFLDDFPSRQATTAERTVLARLQGGCQVPLGAYAQLSQDRLHLTALVATLDGATLLRASASGLADEPQKLGEQVAADLIAQGAQAIIDSIAPRGQNGSFP